MALKKIFISGNMSQGKIQIVNKEASFLRNLSHVGFIKLYFSYFDAETVTVKFTDNYGQKQ